MWSAPIGDSVLRRADGMHAYQRPSSSTMPGKGSIRSWRGADLLLSTPARSCSQRVLGLPTPRYAHMPLARTDRTELSKSLVSAPVIPPTRSPRCREPGTGWADPCPATMDRRRILDPRYRAVANRASAAGRSAPPERDPAASRRRPCRTDGDRLLYSDRRPPTATRRSA